MKPLFVVYGAFTEGGEYREYFDVILTDEGVVLVDIGKLPRIFKKRPALPRLVERQLLRIFKERYRVMYTSEQIEELVRRYGAKFIPKKEIRQVVLRDYELTLSQALAKVFKNSKEKLLLMEVVCTSGRVLRLFTALKLKERLKKSLKSLGLEVVSG
ncbi:MAG: hypothetical protein DRO12_03405 [Thermoprotei archaeon]|nr:MAG: hypothetical protein DRO12_03405 [Thermoprotei archaeon]